MQNQEKNNSFLPSWMCETEQYVPSIDKDGFITKSTQAVLGVLSKLKWKEGKDKYGLIKGLYRLFIKFI